MRPAIDRFYIAKKQAAQRKRAELWAAMRIMRIFTATQLMLVCVNDNRRSVLTYLSLLRRAGYLSVTDAGNQGLHIPKTYLLTRNTGPQPPAILAKRASMFDPNTHEEHSLESDR